MSQKEFIKAIQTTDESLFNELLEGKSKSLDAANFKNAQIGAMRIHTVDASNTEWEACIFDGTVFDGLNFQGAFFNGCSFHECVFQNVIFAETAFDGCVLHKAKLISPQDLEAAEFTNCQFKECVFQNCHFLDTNLESITISAGIIENLDGIAELKSVALRNVTIQNFNTSEMTVANCTASGCTSVPDKFVASVGKRRRV